MKTIPFFLSHLLAALLLFTLFWPPSQALWQTVDIALFKWLNSSLQDRPLWQLFWACANHKLADWVEDICILTFFIIHVRSFPSFIRPRKIAELLFCVLYIAAILYFINRLLFREHLEIPRISPTLFLQDTVRLSHEIPWLSIKDTSSNSFPGDHATTALLFATFLSILASRKMAICAILYGIFLCLPRLITGAHWFSDIFVGSGAIVLITTSWAFFTPFFSNCTKLLEKPLFKLAKRGAKA